MEKFNQENHFPDHANMVEKYRQELLFECDRLALISMAAVVGSETHKEVNQDIEDIKQAWHEDTLESL